MHPTARWRAARRPPHRPAGAGLHPRLRRHASRRLEQLKVGDEFPDGGGWQHAAVRRHAVRLAVIDRLEDVTVGAAVAPTAVAQTGARPAHRPATVTAVAVHHAERALALRRRLPISPEGILGGRRCARRRCDAAREDARLVSHRRGGLVAAARSGDDESQGYRAKIHTIPPWLVCRAISGMKSAGGRTSAGSSDRTSPDSRNQSPPMPAYTAMYCFPFGPRNEIGAPTTPEPTLNFHNSRPVLAFAALNQPSSVPKKTTSPAVTTL